MIVSEMTLVFNDIEPHQLKDEEAYGNTSTGN